MYRRIICLVVLLLSIFISTTNIKSIDNNSNKQINVEIKGEVQNPGIYSFDSSANVSDLLDKAILNEDANIGDLSLLDKLYNNEVIVINNNEKNLISINSASIEELITLPGIGEKTAERIINYRKENGCFNNLNELTKVSGIGNAKYEKIKEYISL